MVFVRRPAPIKTGMLIVLAGLAVAGCASQGPSEGTIAPVAATPDLPPAIKPQEITGRWGLAAFHNQTDLKRTENAARNGCKQPYNIGMGPTGGVIMHMPD